MREEHSTRYVQELNRIFKSAPGKHRAHQRSEQVLRDMTADRALITDLLRRYLSSPDVLNSKNYPVVGIDVELNPRYHLVANCWIPLPDRNTDTSTKAIHHHGTMLLTTATAFGPGYEHWLFTQPKELDPEQGLYQMEVSERKLHPRHDVAFVDAYEPHLPLYPSGLTVTLALWSSREAATWMDRVKRIPLLKKNEAALKRMARGFGIAGAIRLKLVELFDFYPTGKGFKGMKDRIEFGLGPNEDYLQSLFHIIQGTQNDALGALVEGHLERARVSFTNPDRSSNCCVILKTTVPSRGACPPAI